MILDPLGGTDIAVTLQQHVSFTSGTDKLALPVAHRAWPPALVRKLLQHTCQGKPVICINSTGEVAFSLVFTITNDIPCAEVMLVFPHALRHAATTGNRPGSHRGLDSSADLLARHAERLL